MRIAIKFSAAQPIVLPLNHAQYLTGAVYNFLDRADRDYARFLHDEGYAGSDDWDDRHRFKLFAFSTLRARRRRIAGDRLVLGPGEIEWQISSPLDKFLREFATGVLEQGTVRVAREILPIANVETLPTPPIKANSQWACLTPVVSAVSRPDSRYAQYLRPGDGEFPERLRANLMRKYFALHGHEAEDDRFDLEWDSKYLLRHRGTKLIDFKGTQIVGAFCPFTMCGSAELIELAYGAGLGEKNAAGFGMVEVKNADEAGESGTAT